MTPSSQKLESPGKSGRFTLYESGSLWRIRDFGNNGPVNNNRFQNNAVVVAGNDEELFIDFQAPSRTPLENNHFIANSVARTSGTERFVITGIGTVTLEFLQANFGRFFRNNIEAFPEFVSVNLEDPEAFRLQPGSPLINRGEALTSTRTAGFGTSVPVVDAGYFTDGFGVVDGDLVQIGANAPIGVTAVDYEANTLSIGSALAWAAGDQVNLPFEGNAPDIGAFEFGEDEATCDGLTATIVGTAGDESLVGTSGPDVIQGLGGVDTIQGLAGDDVMCGGDGNDTILSNRGNDRAFGEGGNDRVLGGIGVDELDGGANFDQLFGNEGNDEILGGAGRDNLDGGPQQDLCDGGSPDRGDTAVNCEQISGIP
ncbi:MAG: calcium-binding protein [Gammaproteobacteria bacterium]